MPRAKKDKAVKWYVGIVDTLGLDSFAEVGHDNSVSCLQIRAMANPQRHAKVFLASFPAKMDPVKLIREQKDPWEMWSIINCCCTDLRCDPKDAKTIANIQQLAKDMVKHTGSAHGF